MDTAIIAEKLKQRRSALGISYQELAEKTGISKSTIQRYETGNIKSIPVEKLDALAKGLETTVEQLISGTSPVKTAEIIENNIFSIPVFDSASAGFGCYADSCAVCYMPTFIQHGGEWDDYLWINVKGDSMAPLIDDGDRILVKKQDSVENGSVAVVMIEEEAFVKKVKFGKNWVELHSINPYYPVRRIKKEEEASFRIVGLVKEVSKKL